MDKIKREDKIKRNQITHGVCLANMSKEEKLEKRKIQVRERDKRENAATIERAKPRYIKMDWGLPN